MPELLGSLRRNRDLLCLCLLLFDPGLGFDCHINKSIKMALGNGRCRVVTMMTPIGRSPRAQSARGGCDPSAQGRPSDGAFETKLSQSY